MERRDGFDLRSLEVFLAVCDTRSMVRAAERLAITQAAVSQTVARLEEALDVVLLDRGVRPVQLTMAGAALAERARLLLAAAREARQAVRQTGLARIPELRLALVNSLAAAVMPGFYDVLRADLRVEKVALLSGLARDNLTALGDGAVDAVMTAEVPDAAGDLPSVALLSEPFVAVVPRGAPPAASLEELARRLPFIGYSEHSMIGRLVRMQVRRLRLVPAEALVLDSSLCLMDVVAAGHGWAISSPLCLIEGRADPARIEVRPIREPMSPRRIVLYTRRHELGELGHRLAQLAVATVARSVPDRLRPHGEWLARGIRLFPDAPDGATPTACAGAPLPAEG